MFRVFSLLMLSVSGLAGPAVAQGSAGELAWGLGGILGGVAALLIAMGALIPFLTLAKLLEELRERFKR